MRAIRFNSRAARGADDECSQYQYPVSTDSVSADHNDHRRAR
jgi:hypothetical protein